MVYNIEFVRHIDGKAEARALDVISLVGDAIAPIIERAEELYRNADMVPHPDGYRIRDADGEIVHEFNEVQVV